MLVSEILKNRFYGLTDLESDGLAVFILSKTAQAYYELVFCNTWF